MHIRHNIQNVLAHCYAVPTADSNSSSLKQITTILYLGTWGSLVELKCCTYIMVEANSHLKLLPASILDIQSVSAHAYAVHVHMVAALHSYTHPS